MGPRTEVLAVVLSRVGPGVESPVELDSGFVPFYPVLNQKCKIRNHPENNLLHELEGVSACLLNFERKKK